MKEFLENNEITIEGMTTPGSYIAKDEKLGLEFELKALRARTLDDQEDITCFDFTRLRGDIFKFNEIFKGIKDYLLVDDENNIIL